jgi:hypothetical protein
VPAGTVTLPGGPQNFTGPAVPVHHAPGLELAPLRIAPARRPIAERHRPAIPDRFPQRHEGRLRRAEPRLDAVPGQPLVRLVRAGRVDAGRPEFQQRTRCGAGQLGSPPDPGGQAEHGGLVRLEPELGQLVGLLPDPVAEILVERMVDACLQRDAEIAEIFLIPLEHPLEQVIGLRITRNRLPDLLRGEVAPGGEQAHDKTEQPLGLAFRHRPALP